MRKTTRALLMVLVLAAVTMQGYPQGSGAPAKDKSTYQVVQSVTGVVKEIDEEESLIILSEEEIDKDWVIAVDDSTEFDGMTAEDLKPGLKLRIAFGSIRDEEIQGLAVKIKRLE